MWRTVGVAVAMAVLFAALTVGGLVADTSYTGTALGQGTIDSPRGAFTQDPEVSGPAAFALDVSSADGVQTPRGVVNLRLPAAGFAFASTDVQQVSVAEHMVQLSGLGTVNGAGGYGFTVLAERGSSASFRLTVWDTETHEIICDNEPLGPWADHQAQLKAVASPGWAERSPPRVFSPSSCGSAGLAGPRSNTGGGVDVSKCSSEAPPAC